MRVPFWVMLAAGVIEVGANGLFLALLAVGKGIGAAKRSHGDFPPFASDRAWTTKIVASLLLGVVALLAALAIHQESSAKAVLSFLFAGGMLLMGLLQAVRYGNRYLPSRISILFGAALVALLLFQPPV